MVEYPVKTLNISERDLYYQVDTGPILLPLIAEDYRGSLIGALQRAFIAHNAPNYAEAIVNVPTPLAAGITVNHYSKIVPLAATNRMIALEASGR